MNKCIKHGQWVYAEKDGIYLRGKYIDFAFYYARFKVQKRYLLFNILPIYIDINSPIMSNYQDRYCYYYEDDSICHFNKVLQYLKFEHKNSVLL